MDALLQSHRGGVVLALGVLSVVPPFMFLPLGLPAWFMARNDLRAMNERRMDAAERTTTQVGQPPPLASAASVPDVRPHFLQPPRERLLPPPAPARPSPLGQDRP